GRASSLLFFLDGARSVRDVDRGVAETGAELLQTRARTAGLDDRGLEFRERLAEALGNDVGIRQHGGRTGNLDLVASRLGRPGEGKGARDGDGRRQGDELDVHADLLTL